MRLLVLGLFGLLAVGSQPAFAQPAWAGRVRVAVNAGAQLGSDDLVESFTIEKNTEPAPILVEASRTTFPAFDASMTVRAVGPIGLGVAVSYLSGETTGELTADLPHPFFFDQLRRVSGTRSLERSEFVTHTNLAVLAEWSRVEVILSGGASFFAVDQDVVSDVVYEEEYPFDSATFSSATVSRVSASKVGYNLGADLAWKIGRGWGVGGMVRFSRARIPLAVSGVDVGTLDAGGVQAAGGLRFAF
jgi:hypothetical protein